MKPKDMKIKWNIWIKGYGSFNFEGTEIEAEEMRQHKSRWERGVGIKWRVENQRPSDKLIEQQVALWDDGKGVPQSLLAKIKKAKEKEAANEARI